MRVGQSYTAVAALPLQLQQNTIIKNWEIGSLFLQPDIG
jgi:hypothetical protein